MNVDRMSELLRRVFTWGAFALLALAVLEKIANLAGQTMIRASFRPSDLAIALLLGGIRSELRNR